MTPVSLANRDRAQEIHDWLSMERIGGLRWMR
jgi:hypothetical protein